MLGITDYPHPDLNRVAQVPSSEQLVWRAARASGAAPSFFRPEGRFVDGGILANNPSLVLLTEVAEYNVAKRALEIDEDGQAESPKILVSLGTGIPPVKKTKVVDIFRPDSTQDALKLIMNWDGMGKLMLDSVLDADSSVVDHSRAWCMSTGAAFMRLSPQMKQFLELDETDDGKLVDLMWSTMAYIHAKREDIAELKPLLDL